MPDTNQISQNIKNAASQAASQVKDDASPLAADVKKMVDHLREDMTDLRRDMGDVASKWQEKGRAAAAEAGHTLKERASEQAEHLKHAWEVTRDRSRQGIERTEQTIHDHPWTSIAIAFGVGLVIGKLLDRR